MLVFQPPSSYACDLRQSGISRVYCEALEQAYRAGGCAVGLRRLGLVVALLHVLEWSGGLKEKMWSRSGRPRTPLSRTPWSGALGGRGGGCDQLGALTRGTLHTYITSLTGSSNLILIKEYLLAETESDWQTESLRNSLPAASSRFPLPNDVFEFIYAKIRWAARSLLFWRRVTDAWSPWLSVSCVTLGSLRRDSCESKKKKKSSYSNVVSGCSANLALHDIVVGGIGVAVSPFKWRRRFLCLRLVTTVRLHPRRRATSEV